MAHKFTIWSKTAFNFLLVNFLPSWDGLFPFDELLSTKIEMIYAGNEQVIISLVLSLNLQPILVTLNAAISKWCKESKNRFPAREVGVDKENIEEKKLSN